MKQDANSRVLKILRQLGAAAPDQSPEEEGIDEPAFVNTVAEGQEPAPPEDEDLVVIPPEPVSQRRRRPPVA